MSKMEEFIVYIHIHDIEFTTRFDTLERIRVNSYDIIDLAPDLVLKQEGYRLANVIFDEENVASIKTYKDGDSIVLVYIVQYPKEILLRKVFSVFSKPKDLFYDSCLASFTVDKWNHFSCKKEPSNVETVKYVRGNIKVGIWKEPANEDKNLNDGVSK